MYKYVFSGSVGISDRNGGDNVRDYEDVEVIYESRRPLDVKDGPDFALAVMCIKDAYVLRMSEQNLGHLINDQTYVDVMSAGLTAYEPKSFELTKEVTDRGFQRFQFKDTNSLICTLQESSGGDTPKIWLGIDKVVPRYLVPDKGWMDYRLPDHFLVSGRMHLNQIQVAALMPHLQKFVETGEL